MYVKGYTRWEGKEERKEMPQLDIGSYLPQVFWLVICISVLYTGMSSVVESISKMLKSREKKIMVVVKDEGDQTINLRVIELVRKVS